MNATRTARFWTWINDGWTRISVSADRPLHWHRWTRTDEGWASESHTWTLADGTVTDEYATDGRDCDGRLSTSNTFACSADNLEAKESYDGLHHVPDWTPVDSSQRDYAAETAGY